MIIKVKGILVRIERSALIGSDMMSMVDVALGNFGGVWPHNDQPVDFGIGNYGGRKTH